MMFSGLGEKPMTSSNLAKKAMVQRNNRQSKVLRRTRHAVQPLQLPRPQLDVTVDETPGHCSSLNLRFDVYQQK